MIFIIGGNGFVGSAVVRYCQYQGLDHAVVTRENAEKFRGRHCRILINANGNSKKFLSMREPLLDFDLSVRSVRSSLIDFPCDLYVMLSSCDVYPDCSSPELACEDSSIDLARQSPYGFHKYMAEQCVRHVSRNYIILRMGGFIGDGLVKGPIFDILKGGPLWLDPASQLQFLSVDILAKSIFQLAEMGVSNRTLNIGGVGTVTLADIISMVPWHVDVKPDSQKVCYNVSHSNISSLISIPASRDEVCKFISTRIS